MAEAIENNVRKTIADENPVNPKYYDKMSVLLDELIEQRRQKAIDYQEYLKRIRDLSRKVIQPETSASDYPVSMHTSARRALYDNLGRNEVLATKIDSAIRYTKKADSIGDRFKGSRTGSFIGAQSQRTFPGFDGQILARLAGAPRSAQPNAAGAR